MKEKILEKWLYLAGFFAVSLSALILLFLTYFSLPLFYPSVLKNILSFEWQPLYGKYGILPMAFTSLALAVLAVALAFPVGLGLSCLLSGLAPPFLTKIGDVVIRFMTSIPTVIYGFVSIFLLIPFVRDISEKGSGFCLLSAVFVLSILILPTIVLLTSDSFKSVPKRYLESTKSLGFSPIQELIYVIIPHSKFGIINALVLGFGRAVGDTMIALMLAGNAAQVPHSFFDSVRALTAQIALVLASDTESLTFKSIFASGLILFIMMLLASLGSYYIIYKKRSGG